MKLQRRGAPLHPKEKLYLVHTAISKGIVVFFRSTSFLKFSVHYPKIPILQSVDALAKRRVRFLFVGKWIFLLFHSTTTIYRCRSPPVNLNSSDFRLIGGKGRGLQQSQSRKEWLKWKENEEQKLRALDVDEEIIERLHRADWEQFKADRRYYERLREVDTYIDQQAADKPVSEIRSVQNLLDEIENERLYQILISVDKLTLEIVIYKMAGYSPHEIAGVLQLTDKAVYRRLDRLKEKLKKLL